MKYVAIEQYLGGNWVNLLNSETLEGVNPEEFVEEMASGLCKVEYLTLSVHDVLTKEYSSLIIYPKQGPMRFAVREL